ncbi:hypothetical protein EV182_007982 [Spiromyces aspiralis]|uniref:Uncharacterized protein n=1 Tax=Spiromyces aspiralis TaxID=68401 RepID=A0ACC1HLJ7_9FUNG|nr:hypothetical protein EV182_007982 [Spiromyces aspiralis]
MAKSLDWVQERRQLEKLIQPPINEVILYNPDSLTFFEGLSSNFFVTMPKMHSEVGSATGYSGFKVVTAPLDTVLLGTVMRLVLEVCRRDGVEVVYDNPRVDDLLDGRWHGAFITSTSRLVYPIEVFHYRSEASGE